MQKTTTSGTGETFPNIIHAIREGANEPSINMACSTYDYFMLNFIYIYTKSI